MNVYRFMWNVRGRDKKNGGNKFSAIFYFSFWERALAAADFSLCEALLSLITCEDLEAAIWPVSLPPVLF